MDCRGSICRQEKGDDLISAVRSRTAVVSRSDSNLSFLDGLLQLLLQAANTRHGLNRTGCNLHRQLKVLADHFTWLVAKYLMRRPGVNY